MTNPMTKETILRKAIEKAFPKDVPHMWDSLKDDLMFGKRYYEIIFSKDFARAFWGEENTCYFCGSITPEVFETHNSNGHDRDVVCAGCGADWISKTEFDINGNYIPSWQYHLQQMVLEDDPITYLTKGL